MPNNYFQFKEFLIKQDKCAMKVCTDACLFGAFIAQNSKLKAQSCLDIGTGTGLLSLMFAQKNSDIIIDAVEIDESSAKQAEENFEASRWNERIKMYNDSIQQFSASTNKKYDVIICNPPFYENDLKSENKQRNLALHSDALSLQALISIADLLLKDDGNFFVLLPSHRTKYFEELLANNKLFIRERVFIKQTPKHNYFRTMYAIEKIANVLNQSEIIIVNEKNEYSTTFKNLLKDYYLNLQ